MYIYKGESKRFRPDELFKVTEIKQLCYFSIASLYFNTYRYINITIDGAIYPSQHFPFGAAFVCQAGNFWTHLPIYIYIYIYIQSVPGGMCQTSGGCSLC